MIFTPRKYAPFNLDETPYEFTQPNKRIAYDARSFKWVNSGEEIPHFLEDEKQIHSIFKHIDNQASFADCERRRMGCVVTDLGLNIQSYGHNGKPEGVSGKCQTVGCIPALTCRLTLHAEQTALLEIDSFDTKVLFCTAVSCTDCMKVCLAKNVRYVVYQEERDQPEYDRPILSALTLTNKISLIKVVL